MSDRPLTETLPEHLGGHQGMTWIDEPVLDYLIDRYGVTSMLDIGCGPGGMVDAARARGLSAWGIDGDWTIGREYVVMHDYTAGPYPARGFDLIWCVEFVEHVAAEYEANYLATFDAGRVLYLTAAYPGQGGHHHVNEQPAQYWIERLGRRGWVEDLEATQWVRRNGATPFAQMTGMVFTMTGQ